MNNPLEPRVASCERRIEYLLRLVRQLMAELKLAQQALRDLQGKA